MEYLSEMLLFSFPIEYVQILNCVHNSPSEKQCCLKMPLLCFDSMHIQSEKRNVNRCAIQCVSRKRGSQTQLQRSTEPGWQAGWPPGSQAGYLVGDLVYSLWKAEHFCRSSEWWWSTEPVLWFQTEAGFCRWANDTNPNAPCDPGCHSSESVGLWNTHSLGMAAGVTVCNEGHFLETLRGVLHCAKGMWKVWCWC